MTSDPCNDPIQKPYHHGDLAAALVAAGEDILRETGMRGFSLRECARRAGVAHSAPAHHFGEARGLITAIATRGFERLDEAMRLVAAQSSEQALANLGRAYLRFAVEDPVIFKLMFDTGQLDLSSARFHAAATKASDQLAQAVAQERGIGMAELDPDDLAFAWATVHGMAMLLVGGALSASPLSSNMDQLADGLVRRVRAALRAG